MTENDKLQMFEDQMIRTAWDETKEEWYFSIVDVVKALTEQSTPRGASNYWAKLKGRRGIRTADKLSAVEIESGRWQAPSDRCSHHGAASSHHPIHSVQESRTMPWSE